MVKARWQPKMLQPFENQSHVQMMGLNTGFQIVWYSYVCGIQMFGIQIPTVVASSNNNVY
jgi:hypothetical protein